MDKEKTIVCKFGGTSMADEESVKKVEKIVKSDVSRKYIVVSAPGRSEKGEKVTDLLVDCFHEIESDGSCDRSFEKVAARFMKVAPKLEGVENVLREVKSQMEQNRGYDFCVSRGEYLSALFFAKRIGYLRTRPNSCVSKKADTTPRRRNLYAGSVSKGFVVR